MRTIQIARTRRVHGHDSSFFEREGRGCKVLCVEKVTDTKSQWRQRLLS